MILKVFLFVLIGVTSYLIMDLLASRKKSHKVSKYLKQKNEKYYEELLKFYEKNKKVKLVSKLNLFYRINLLFEKAGMKRGILCNPITMMILSFASFLLAYSFIFSVFRIVALSFLIALPFSLLPFFILSCIAEMQSKKIEKVMLNFLLQLKNSTQIKNDIIYAFQEVKTIEPLQGYIRKFLVEINSGVKFEEAIENLKNKISFQKFQMVFTNMQYCYLHGGSFSELMKKSYQLISQIQKEKTHREQETMSARMVLVILIVLDLFVYFTFVKNNYENYRIMTRSLFGNVILYWNFISIWILLFLIHKVKKLDY